MADHEFGKGEASGAVAYSFIITSEREDDDDDLYDSLELLNGNETYLSITATAGDLQDVEDICYACLEDSCDEGFGWDFVPTLEESDTEMRLQLQPTSETGRKSKPIRIGTTEDGKALKIVIFGFLNPAETATVTFTVSLVDNEFIYASGDSDDLTFEPSSMSTTFSMKPDLSMNGRKSTLKIKYKV